MVVICWVSTGKDMVLAPKQLQASYTDGRHWEELIDFIDKNGGPKELYIRTWMFKYILKLDEFEEDYMGLYTNRQMISNPIYGQISFRCCLSKAVKMEFGCNLKRFLVEIKRATEMEIAEHVIRQTKVIPASCVKAWCAQLVTIIHRLWKVLKRVEEKRERRIVGKRMILVLM